MKYQEGLCPPAREDQTQLQARQGAGFFTREKLAVSSCVGAEADSIPEFKFLSGQFILVS